VDPATGDRRIFLWLLSESYDVFGNVMKYRHKAENLDGLESLPGDVQALERDRSAAIICRAKYLKSIYYGNTTPNRSISEWQPEPYHGPWLFQVILDYGDHDTSTPRIEPDRKWPARQGRFSACTSGFEIRWLRLCRRILMFHHFPENPSDEPHSVSSASFRYDELDTGTFLTTFTQHGHLQDA